ncbi:MAG: TlpA disulfide reductase family protein [Bacteroidota bacterium]
MKKLYIFLTTLCIAISCSYAQQNPETLGITLSGNLASGSLIKPADSLEVYFFKEYDHRIFERPAIYKIPIINGAFDLRIDTKQKGYLLILNLYIRTFYTNLFLVNPGDNLQLKGMGARKFNFTGRGSAAMNYQMAAGRILYAPEYKFREDMNDTLKIAYLRNKERMQINTCLDSLRLLKNQLSERHYEELRRLTIFAIKSIGFFDMSSFADTNDPQYKKALAIETARRLSIEQNQPEQEKRKNTEVFTYLFYLTEMNKTLLTLRYGTSKFPFEAGYDLIISKYNSSLRDKLLLQYFGMNKQSPTVPLYLPKALSLVKHKGSKTSLQQMADARLPGNLVYPFSFQDTLGKVTRISDLKGRVVLIDSWFVGCINCSILKKQMKPVIEHFKTNPNVVFLSLNVDQDKQRFIKGVNSGEYTAPESMNLYTNGMGTEHPMLKYYQYNGYPNLLLIDKQGKLISANPPRPVEKRRVNELIELITNNL